MSDAADRPRGTALPFAVLVTAVVLVSINLRPGASSPGAVLEEVRQGWPSQMTGDLGRPELTDDEIRERMSGNICRCSCYPNIVDAIRDAAGRTGGTAA